MTPSTALGVCAIILIPGLVACGGGSGGGSALVVTNCEDRGDEYFAGISKTTDDGLTTIELTSAEPAPPANSYSNKWTLKVTDSSLAPLSAAMVIAAPYMIDHGHGAPNVYGVEGDAGVYVIDPLSLKMNGLWDVTIKVVPLSGAETRVVFKFCVRPI